MLLKLHIYLINNIFEESTVPSEFKESLVLADQKFGSSNKVSKLD